MYSITTATKKGTASSSILLKRERERFHWNMNCLCRFSRHAFLSHISVDLFSIGCWAPIAKYYHVDLCVCGACTQTTINVHCTTSPSHHSSHLNSVLYIDLIESWFLQNIEQHSMQVLAHWSLKMFCLFSFLISFFSSFFRYYCFSFYAEKQHIPPFDRSLFHFKKRCAFHPRQLCMLRRIKMLLYHQYHIAFYCMRLMIWKKKNRFLVSIYENESGELYVM